MDDAEKRIEAAMNHPDTVFMILVQAPEEGPTVDIHYDVDWAAQHPDRMNYIFVVVAKALADAAEKFGAPVSIMEMEQPPEGGRPV